VVLTRPTRAAATPAWRRRPPLWAGSNELNNARAFRLTDSGSVSR